MKTYNYFAFPALGISIGSFDLNPETKAMCYILQVDTLFDLIKSIQIRHNRAIFGKKSRRELHQVFISLEVTIFSPFSEPRVQQKLIFLKKILAN